MSLRSGLAFFTSSASSVARFIFCAAGEESSVDDNNDEILVWSIFNSWE